MKKLTIVLIILIGILVQLFYFSLILRILNFMPTFSAKFSKSPALALIEIEGVLSDSRRIVRQLKKYTKDPNIKGILLRIDSPGGGVTPAQEIYSEIIRAKKNGKKIIVSMGSVAASGGYYISAPADIIVANPGTITGSIGVIMQFPIIEELLKKFGVKFEVIKSKELKDIGSPFRKMTPQERALLSEIITDVYEQFVTVVSENRKIAKDELLKIADGRIFSGRQAKEFGLVDSLGTLEDAIKIAARVSGIKGEPRIVRERKRFIIFEELFMRINKLLFFPELRYLPSSSSSTSPIEPPNSR